MHGLLISIRTDEPAVLMECAKAYLDPRSTLGKRSEGVNETENEIQGEWEGINKEWSKAVCYHGTFLCICFTDIYSISEHQGQRMIIR